MTDLTLKILTGVLRVVLIPVTSWLVAHGILTSDETVQFIAELTSWCVAIGWAAYAWYKAKQREHTALAFMPGMTPNELTERINAGTTAPATTAGDVAPRLTTVYKEFT